MSEGDRAGSGVVGPLLERDAVLARLDRTLKRAVDERGATLFVVGEAGLGKTSVLDEALRRAKGRFSVAHGRGAASEVGLPFGLVDQILGEWPQAGGFKAVSQEQHFYRALRQLQSSAAKGPVLVALDDLHWSDPDSLSLVHFLVRRINAIGVAVVATLRPWPSPAMDVVSALIADGAASLERLAALSADAVGELLCNIEGKQLDGQVTAQVHRASGGNPLLVNQLAAIVRQPTDDSTSVRLRPDLGRRYLLTRFADVDAEGLELLRAACVLGVRFRPEVAALMIGLPSDRTTAILAGLQRAGVVRVSDGLEAGFVHDLFRQALYEDLTGAERRRLHEAALRALDTSPAASASEAAPHAIEARLVGDLQAISVLERAAHEANRAGAVQVAKAHLEAAVDLARDAVSPATMIELATLTLADGDMGNARELAHQVLMAPDLPPATRMAALDCIGNAHMADGDFVQATQWWRAAEIQALRVSPRLAAANLLAHAPPVWLATGPPGASNLALRARGLAGDFDPVLRDQADLTASAFRYLAGDPIILDGFAGAQRRLFHGIDESDRRRAFMTSIDYGLAVMSAERFSESDAVFEAIAERAENFSDPVPLSRALWHLADLAWRQGQLQRAAELIARARELDDLVPAARPFTVALAALISLDRGQFDEASNLLAGAEPTSGPFSEMWLCLARGILALRQGHLEHARGQLDRVARQAELTGLAEPCAIPWAAPAIQAAEAAHATDEVESVVAWLEPLAERLSCRWPKGTLAYGRAVLAEARGHLEEAELQHAQSVLCHQEGRQPMVHAAALVRQGAFLRRRGRAREARQPVASALQVAAFEGPSWHAEWARRELVQAGGRPSRREGILTVQEAAVARLAAAGLSNPDIAKQLYVSVKTVETHLGRVYTKLGVANRKQLQERPELLA